MVDNVGDNVQFKLRFSHLRSRHHYNFTHLRIRERFHRLPEVWRPRRSPRACLCGVFRRQAAVSVGPFGHRQFLRRSEIQDSRAYGCVEFLCGFLSRRLHLRAGRSSLRDPLPAAGMLRDRIYSPRARSEFCSTPNGSGLRLRSLWSLAQRP